MFVDRASLLQKYERLELENADRKMALIEWREEAVKLLKENKALRMDLAKALEDLGVI